MILVCPRCDTNFSLPDELYKEGRKARCSQCGNVFHMPSLPAPDGPASEAAASQPPPRTGEGPAEKPGKAAPAGTPSQAGKGRRAGILQQGESSKTSLAIFLAVCLICLAGLGYGGYMLYKTLLASPPAVVETGGPPAVSSGETPEEKAVREAQEARERVRHLALDDVSQFVIDNENLGRLVVIQGRVVNNFTTPKELIWVEAKLFDREGKVLSSAKQIAGVSLSAFQLGVLNAREMTAALNNKVEVLLNNINIQPGGSTPFMVVFQGQPEGMYEYEVRPIDASDPPGLLNNMERERGLWEKR